MGGTYRRGVAAPQCDVVRVEALVWACAVGGGGEGKGSVTHLGSAWKGQAAVWTVVVSGQGAEGAQLLVVFVTTTRRRSSAVARPVDSVPAFARALTSSVVVVVVMQLVKVGTVETLMVAVTMVVMPLVTRVITGLVLVTPARGGTVARVLGKPRGQLQEVMVTRDGTYLTGRVSTAPLYRRISGPPVPCEVPGWGI